MDGIDAVQAATVGAALVALGVSILTYFWSAAERTYFEYTNRYREVLLALPSGFFDDKIPLASIKDEETRERIPRVVQSYVDLCSEEVKLRLRLKVWGKVWRDWSDGMRAGLMSENVRAVLGENEGAWEYRVLFGYLNHDLKTSRNEYRHPPAVPWKPLVLGVDKGNRPGQ